MRTAKLAALAALALTSPLTAQSAQERLDDRYNHALAAGYKALMLCSAIANAERNGASRTPESVHQWELTGIYPALDPIIRELPYEIVRSSDGRISHVAVEWQEGAPQRIAQHEVDAGCHVLPIGMEPVAAEANAPPPATNRAESEVLYTFTVKGKGLAENWPPEPTQLDLVLQAAHAGEYGAGSRTTVTLVRQQSGEDGWSESARYTAGYDEKTPQRTWSVAKSIAATLVGAAVNRGEADVSDSAGLGVSENDPRRAITIDHLLRMASGRYSDTPGNRTDPLYWGGTTVDERAMNWPLIHAPGTVYRYANNDTLAAVKAIEETLQAHPPAELFERVGMFDTVAETDWQGNYVLSSQVWATAEDLADLGQLYLNDGVLPDGTRVLPEGWLEYVSTPSGPQPEGRPWGYGAGWWLLDNSDGVPPDTILAAGNRGQYIVVVPSRDVVIVRRGEDMVGTRFDIAAFTRDVLEVLESE